MIKSLKITLLPTKEQEILMLKSIGCSRFAYNWALSKCNEVYKQGIKYSISDIRKQFTKLKKENDFKWLNEVSNTTMVESMRNLDKAFKSFYKIPKCKYSNPYCSYDGKYWYILFGYEQNENQVELDKKLSIGIDLGVKDLAICSNGTIIKNINKSIVVRKSKKRLKRLQRQVSRKYDNLKNNKTFFKGEKFIKTQNIIKLERKIKLIYRRLNNIKNNHIHQATNKIIKLYPYRIVMEDLKLKDRVYKCGCGLSIDRDLNASINLSKYQLV